MPKNALPEGAVSNYPNMDTSGRLFTDPDRWTGWINMSGSGEVKLHVTQASVVGKFIEGFPGKAASPNGVPFKPAVEPVLTYPENPNPTTPDPVDPTDPTDPDETGTIPDPGKIPESLAVSDAFALEDQPVYLGDHITMESGNEGLLETVVITGLPPLASFSFDNVPFVTVSEAPSGISFRGMHDAILKILETLYVKTERNSSDDFTLTVDRYDGGGTKIASGDIHVDIQPVGDEWIISTSGIDLVTNEWLSLGEHVSWAPTDADGSEQVTSVDITLSVDSLDHIRYAQTGAQFNFYNAPNSGIIAGVQISGTEQEIRSALDSLQVFYDEELTGSFGVSLITADSGYYGGTYYSAVPII